LACTVWAEIVTISQLLSFSEDRPSQATIALSAILIVGILLLVVLLPVAFFRAKLQDAREQAQCRKVIALLASSICVHMSPAPYRWRSQLRRTSHRNEKCPRFDRVCYPMRTVIRLTGSGLGLHRQTTMSRERRSGPRPAPMPSRSMPQSLPLSCAPVPECLGASCGLCAAQDPMEHTTGADHPALRPQTLRPRQAPCPSRDPMAHTRAPRVEGTEGKC
jgi:hypothetical protein